MPSDYNYKNVRTNDFQLEFQKSLQNGFQTIIPKKFAQYISNYNYNYNFGGRAITNYNYNYNFVGRPITVIIIIIIFAEGEKDELDS